GGEKQLRVVIQKDEAHVMERANEVPSALEVAVQQLQERAQPASAARREWDDDGQLRDLTQTAADAACAFNRRRRRFGRIRRQLSEHVLECLFPKLRRVGEDLAQLLDLLGGSLLMLRNCRGRCLRIHVAYSVKGSSKKYERVMSRTSELSK